MNKLYSRILWKNRPDKTTPITAENLNRMDKGINDLDDRIIKVGEELLGNIEETTYKAVQEYTEKNGLTTGATPEESRKIEQNATDIDILKSEKAPAIICESSGEDVYITDSANARLAGFEIYGKGIQNEEPTPDYPVEIVNAGTYDEESGKYKVEIGIGSKNLLANTASYPSTSNGITFTVDDQKRVIANGTSTGYAVVRVGNITLPAGRYIINGCPEGGSVLGGGEGTYSLRLLKVSEDVEENIAYITGQEREFELTEYTYLRVFAYVYNNFIAENLTFEPMIRLADISDHVYEMGGSKTSVLYLDEPLRATKDDSFRDHVSNNGKIVRQISQMILNGNEAWSKDDSGENGYFIRRIGDYGTVVNNRCTSSHFKQGAITNSTGGINLINVVNSSGYNSARLYIRPEGVSGMSVDDFKEWLSKQYENGTPVVVQYVFSAPSIEQIPESEEVKLKELSTFYHKTTIFNSERAKMDVGYVADTELYIENKCKMQGGSTGEPSGPSGSPEVETDKTLTIPGRPADAKATGDALRGKIAIPSMGKIGQVLVVKAVDSNGKPTAFETIEAIGSVVYEAARYGILPDNDGLTNSQNLQTLIDKVGAAGGGTIYIPTGTYEFAPTDAHYYQGILMGEQCINYKDNVSIIGDGATTILKPVGKTQRGLSMFYHPGRVGQWLYKYLENCVFKNFAIDGIDSDVEIYSTSGKGFFFQAYKNCHWDNVIVANTTATGFGMDFPINSSMTRCAAINCGRAATVDSPGASGFGIGFGLSIEESFYMDKCVAMMNKRFGFFFEHQQRFKAYDPNEFTATDNYGFDISNCTGIGNYWNFGAIQGNRVMYRDCYSANAGRFGYYLENSHDCQIANCYSNAEVDSGYVIKSDETDGIDVSTKYNEIKDCTSKYTLNGIKVVQVGGTEMKGNVIKNNTIIASQRFSVETMGTMKSLVLQGNTIVDGAGNVLNATVENLTNIGNSWN